ncbi:hypothetical protein H072_5287 [Dactylellina haptotyla CBS 200.50]|uniref:Uncharacterized protein n=1 Tax=Dactylellina haptotyla (strain CBS 200.50) TaxID=1284197 RepID=S8BN50_DACHA|nr:hypothetical protein H072_5287 [Dactylellina haptotyla CBS 200.50]
MEKLESLTISDASTSINDLPVEILRGIIDQVVLSTGFYAALELRRVNKLFDVITLDSALDTSQDDHEDAIYLDISDELAFTALHRRVTDSATRSPALVSTIRTLSEKIYDYDPSLELNNIQECLCWTAIIQNSAAGIFNWRKGEYTTSVNAKHKALQKGIAKIEADGYDGDVLDWYICLIHTFFYDFENLKEVYELMVKRGDKGKYGSKPFDYQNPVFMSIPLAAVRFATHEIAIWCYKNSTIAATIGQEREDFLKIACTFGRTEIIKYLAEESKDLDDTETELSFGECPRWATSADQLELVKVLLVECEEYLFKNVAREVQWVFLTACTHGNLGIAKWCVEEKGFSPESGLKTQGLRFNRPLCQATQSGNAELVRWLIEVCQLGSPDQLRISFEWAMKYAGVDMVELYFEKGLPVDIEASEWVGGPIVEATFAAAATNRPDHLKYALKHGVYLTGGDEHTVVAKAASGGAVKSLKVIEEHFGEECWEYVTKMEMRNAIDGRDGRAVEALQAVGIKVPEGWNEREMLKWDTSAHIIPTFNWSRKKWGYWPYRWTYSTNF